MANGKKPKISKETKLFVKNNLKKVSATLKHGKLLGPLGVAMLWLMVLLFTGLTLLFQLWGVDNPVYMAASYLWIFAGAFIFLYILLQSIAKRDVKLWLQDAVTVEAFCVEIERPQGDARDKFFRRIQLLFVYEGKEICLVSQDMPFFKKDVSQQLGTGKIFRQYVNKRIKILYSPTHNQAMLLKPDKNVGAIR